MAASQEGLAQEERRGPLAFETDSVQIEQCLACEGWDRGNERDAAMVFHSNDIQTRTSFP